MIILAEPMLTRERQPFLLSISMAVLALLGSFGLFAWFYLVKRQAFFDDVFIYLHIARNGADFGTWQFFPLVDRPALLASSPLKISLLTVAAWISGAVGYADRNLLGAKALLVIYAPLAWLIWWPFWRAKRVWFFWLGALYFLVALALDATVDFEGGLLLLWGTTIVMLLGGREQNMKLMGWMIPLGLMIRPDVALPVLLALAVVLGRRGAREFLLSSIRPSIILLLAWLLLCWFMDVWFIPVTYWAKGAFPTFNEQKYMIDYFFERVGQVSGGRVIHTSAMATVVGIFVVVGFVLTKLGDKRTRLAIAVTGVVTIILLSKAPASFWWYYQNVVLVMLGAAVGVVVRQEYGVMLWQSLRRSAPSLMYVLMVFALLIVGKAGMDGPSVWRFDSPSRAQAYEYLAARARGDGTYDLPGIGRVFIKNPEMGIMNFFAGSRAWVWDSAGLAQPLDDPRVGASALRIFYPSAVRLLAVDDAKQLAAKSKNPLRVVEVWGMEDRDFDAARKKCRYVIEEGAICANDFQVTVR